jgi:DNA topoisomerase-3
MQMETLLIIAEKPSVAKAIAACLEGKKSGGHSDGYITVGDTTVTWCFGHILELAPPEHYNKDYKRWDVSHLPYQVPAFELLPKDDAKAQLKVIGKLLKQKPDAVVNCGDPDREGQMLVDEVLEYHEWTGKTSRMLLNSTDDESVKKALADLKDNKQFYNLYQSAICRSRADWIVGLNLTVAATKLLSSELVSIGRVQTPTLNLVVQRDLDIQNFKKREFWTVVATMRTPDGQNISLKHEPKDEDRIFDKSVADGIVLAMTGKTFNLTVQTNDKKESPPKPYSLLTFSKDAGKRYGWTAKQCLDILQKLYEPEFGLTTYPRTQSEYLKDEHRAAVPRIVGNVLATRHFEHARLLAGREVIRDSVFNSAKVEEHHAIIPTSKPPGENLTGDYLKAYLLVAERFLMVVSPDFAWREVVASIDVDGRIFQTKGNTPLNTESSWRLFAPKKETTLPDIQPGTATVEKAVPMCGETSPPKPYTEGDLMTDMASIAKFVTDEKLKARLKETSGIGTAATRAAVLETLKKRGYIEEQGKNIVSTPFGRSFIASMPDSLKSPGMTAIWEDALDLIAKGQYQPEEFMVKINSFVTKRIADMKAMAGSTKISGSKGRGAAALAKKK